jgi:hypothetical protein
MKNTILLIAFTLSGLFSMAQNGNTKDPNGKGALYVHWGYNRTGYTKSDLRIVGPGYDLTMKNAKAHDNPYPFSAENYFSPARLTIPQFNLRIGYNYKKNWSISFGYDHMKYLFANGNQVNLHGHVDPGVDTVTNFSGNYNGEAYSSNRNTFHYENSNGLNYIRFELTHTKNIFSLGRKGQFGLSSQAGVATGFIFSVNDLNFAGQHDMSTYSISGYGVSAHAGLRLEFFKHFYIQPNVSGGFLHQLHVRTRPEDRNAYARQSFGYYEYNFVVGGIFYLKGAEDCDCPKW